MWYILLAFGIFSLPLTAQIRQETKVDYARVLPSIQGFEAAIHQAITASVPNPLFGLVGKPKGAYKDDLGYLFSFVINPKWGGMVNTPMGAFPSGPALTPEQKRQSVDGLKNKLVELLFARGPAMPQLEKDKSILIFAYFEETSPDRGNVRQTIILSVTKSDLDEFAGNQPRFNEFKQRVKIVEY